MSVDQWHITNCSVCKKKLQIPIYTIKGIDDEAYCSGRCQDVRIAERRKDWVNKLPRQEVKILTPEEMLQDKIEDRKVAKKAPVKLHKDKPIPLEKKQHVVQDVNSDKIGRVEKLVLKFMRDIKVCSLGEILNGLKGQAAFPDSRQASWNLVKLGKMKYEQHKMKYVETK